MNGIVLRINLHETMCVPSGSGSSTGYFIIVTIDISRIERLVRRCFGARER